MTTTAAVSDAQILERFEQLALAAGREVMRVFQRGCAVDRKADDSPVTEADRAAEAIILAGLRETFPDIPCVAEEEIAAGVLPPELGRAFFLVDPLDGTKEFIKGGSDFTVNVALVENRHPVTGIVYAPARGQIWWGDVRAGWARRGSASCPGRRSTAGAASPSSSG